jgi:hypothetical protein
VEPPGNLGGICSLDELTKRLDQVRSGLFNRRTLARNIEFPGLQMIGLRRLPARAKADHRKRWSGALVKTGNE